MPLNKLFFQTATQKTLKLFLNKPTQDILASDVKKELALSRAGINIALNKLLEQGLIQERKAGNASIYNLASDHLIIRHAKTFNCIMSLYQLIEALSESVDKIILFGSCARGDSTEDSDIDLMVLTRNKKEAAQIIAKFKNDLPIKSIFKTLIEFIDLEKSDLSFYREVISGVILFEAQQSFGKE